MLLGYLRYPSCEVFFPDLVRALFIRSDLVEVVQCLVYLFSLHSRNFFSAFNWLYSGIFLAFCSMLFTVCS